MQQVPTNARPPLDVSLEARAMQCIKAPIHPFQYAVTKDPQCIYVRAPVPVAKSPSNI